MLFVCLRHISYFCFDRTAFLRPDILSRQTPYMPMMGLCTTSARWAVLFPYCAKSVCSAVCVLCQPGMQPSISTKRHPHATTHDPLHSAKCHPHTTTHDSPPQQSVIHTQQHTTLYLSKAIQIWFRLHTVTECDVG